MVKRLELNIPPITADRPIGPDQLAEHNYKLGRRSVVEELKGILIAPVPEES